MRQLLSGALACIAILTMAAVSMAGDDLLMGNPSGAKPDPADKNDFLMEKQFFTLSYNNAKGTPNWVSWHLTKATIGDQPRRRKFLDDTTLPAGFVRVTTDDYKNSGFDRGHMCPHSDRNKTPEENISTFIMTNLVPQSGPNNQGAWNALEIYLRFLVEKKGKELYIVSGPAGIGGVGKSGAKNKIGGGKVTVPNSTWKVILVLDANDAMDDLSRVNDETRLIAVNVPNDMTVDKKDWGKYRTSVKDIEDLTGYTFFSEVSAKLGSAKDEVDDDAIPDLPAEH